MTAADPRDGLRKDGRPGIDRLWDSQWVNVVNSPEVLEALRNYEYEDAVNIAVRLTEKKMAENFAHARPEAVDEAMVQRACVAHFNGMYAGGNGSGTAFTWEAAPESMKAKPRQAMRAALTAALTPERAP